MKIKSIISNPFFLIATFCGILISGESFGGFYLLYILLGLPHGTLHSILAVLGISMLVFSNQKYNGFHNNKIESSLNIAGVLSMIFSLVSFFYFHGRYNFSTFSQILPLVILLLFALLSVSYLVFNLLKLRTTSS